MAIANPCAGTPDDIIGRSLLANHEKKYLLDKRDRFLKEGKSDEEAARLAIREYKNETLDNLHDINHQLGTPGFEQPRQNISSPKTSDNAIRQQSPTAMGAHGNGGESTGRPGEGSGMGSGQQGNEPPGEGGGGTPPPESAGEVQGEDPELIKMANAVQDEFVKKKFGSDALMRIIDKLQDTKLKAILQRIKDRVDSGRMTETDFQKMRERIITTKEGSEEDQAALMFDLARLKEKEQTIVNDLVTATDPTLRKTLAKELDETRGEMMDNAFANRSIGRSASTIFRLRQLWVNRDMTIGDMQEEYKATKGITGELSKEQQAEIQKTYDEIKQAKADLVTARAELEKASSEIARLSQENEQLRKLKNQARAQKKADRGRRNNEAIARSKARIETSRETLRQLGGNLTSGPDPRVAIEFAKIAAEKVYQGVVKFDELVRNVYDEVKDIMPHLTIQDAANYILMEKNDKGELVPSAAGERYQKAKAIFAKNNADMREKVGAVENAQREVAYRQFEWDKERRQDLMKDRGWVQKATENIIRFQRFNILMYPSTIAKLAAVVGHQLTLKPLKFVIQKGIAQLPFIKEHASIWGDPKLSSLAAYYSAFIRNFSLQNFREHFSGIDTKELLYGNKPFMYDEWSAATGLLEMPGRSHGYIKSFIKNPEFKFAHEQQISYHLDQMKKISEQLKATDLTDEKRAELEAQLGDHDPTNEDVLQRINRLSLEHGKWAILMNDNKVTEAMNAMMSKTGLAGAFLRTELPIVKVPLNYIGRAFSIKYGLFQALAGRYRRDGFTFKQTMPSIVQLFSKSTREGMTENQANLLGKTLSMGTLGAGFFGLGYFMHDKIKENPDGSFEIGDMHVSKTLGHSPELESVFSGANTANSVAARSESDRDFNNWFASFAESDMEIAKKNPFASMLAYGFLPKVANVLLSNKLEGDQKLQQIRTAGFRKIADMITPGMLKQSAEATDTEQPGIHPNQPAIKRVTAKDEGPWTEFLQTLELGVPGLRKNVPEKSPAGSYR